MQAELAEQHAEEAAEAAAALKQTVQQLQTSQTGSKNTTADAHVSQQPSEQHLELLQQQQKQQQKLDQLAAHCSELQQTVGKLHSELDTHIGQAQHAQHAQQQQEMQHVTLQCTELAGQLKAAQARLDSHALHGAAQEQQQEAQHAEVQRQIQMMQQQAQQAQHDAERFTAQCKGLQEDAQHVKASLSVNAEASIAIVSSVEAVCCRVKTIEQSMASKPQQQLGQAESGKVQALSAVSQQQQHQLAEVQKQVEAVQRAVATASSIASSSCGKLEEQVSTLRAEVLQHAQHDVEVGSSPSEPWIASPSHTTSLHLTVNTAGVRVFVHPLLCIQICEPMCAAQPAAIAVFYTHVLKAAILHLFHADVAS